MKKETVNTFDGGLNKDLNPIVTPNNVLTDCLNGTFLTFNGDELVLQNDSGNTTITGPKDIGNVSLSEGFEPLGIKEYGGILYIVSVRKAYDSLGRRVPSEDEVEFGSYPSPESASYRILPSAGTLNLNNNKNSLYKTFVINKEDFKAGRDVSFTENVGSPNIMNNVWRPSNPNALYNVKLLLSLNSGTIDLTNDIWGKFLEHVEDTESTQVHWLFDPEFHYYCPFNYRGKLLLKVEFLEPTFKVKSYHDLLLRSGWYTFKISLNTKNSESLQVKGYNVEITSDNNTEVEVIDVGTVQEDVSFQLPALFRGSQLSRFKYSITPKLAYSKNSSVVLDWADFPEEFKRKFTISGTVIVNEELKDLNLIPLIYGELNGVSIVNAILLVGKDNQPVDLSQTDIKGNDRSLVFWREGVGQDPQYESMGTFSIDNEYVGSLTWTEELDETVEDTVKDYLGYKATQIKVYGDNIEGNDFLKLLFDTPVELDGSGKLKNGSFTYYGMPMNYETLTEKEFKLGPIEHGIITLNVNITPFREILIDNMLWSSPNSYKVPLVIEDFYYVGKTNAEKETYRYKTSNIPNHYKSLGKQIIMSFDTYKYKLQCHSAEVRNSTLMIHEGVDSWYFYIDLIKLDIVSQGPIVMAKVTLTAEVVTIEDGYSLSPELIRSSQFQKMGTNSMGYILMPKETILDVDKKE